MGLKPNTTRRLAITVVIAAVICMSTQAGYAAAGPVISVEPTYTAISQGDTFTVNITIDPDGIEIYGAQYNLYFNNSLLKAMSQNKGAFLSQDGAITNVYKNNINNTIGRVLYSETRMGTDIGVTTSGALTTITFEVIGKPEIGELRLDTVKLGRPNATYLAGVTIANGRVGTDQPPTLFMVRGHVFYEDGSDCNDPAVTITNLNTSREWTAEMNETSNYYQLMLSSCADIIAGEILQSNVASPAGSRSNVTEHTVTHGEVDAGGFEHNIMIESRPGDINGDGKLTSADVAIALQMAVCGEYDSIADINCDKSVTSLDALMILQAADSNIGHSMTLSW